MLCLCFRFHLYRTLHEQPKCNGQLQGLRRGRSNHICRSAARQAVPSHPWNRRRQRTLPAVDDSVESAFQSRRPFQAANLSG